jgi:glycosyltransferase involved in cell wall biosynthesis
VENRVVAVIPCYNTSRTIGQVVAETKRYVGCVVVVDDGSSDDTARLARSAGAEVVSLQHHPGYAEAVRVSFDVARKYHAGVLVTLDGDAQHYPGEIDRVIAPVLDGQADMTIGSRFLTGAAFSSDKDYVMWKKRIAFLRTRPMPRYRGFGIKLITRLFNIGYACKLTDAQSCFRAFNRKAMDCCYPEGKGKGVSVEILVRARAKGLTIKEVPITCVYHQAGSTSNPVLHGAEVIFAIIKLKLVRPPQAREKT